MGYAVAYRDAAGEARLEDVTSLEGAVELVERLRNEDGASDVRAFREVPLEVRTYYKVVAVEGNGAPVPVDEVPAPVDELPAAPQDPPPGAMPLSPPKVTVHAESSGGEEPAADGRRGSLFSRG
jgi:hypothetical protein